MSPSTAVLAFLAICLFVLNVYQFLIRRSALRIGEILYIMSRNVREKAAEIRREKKDVEIVEAHLIDIATSARSLLKTLGRCETSLGPDPVVALSPGSGHIDSKSLFRLADNILYTVKEDFPGTDWDEVVNRALDRFLEKVPVLDQEGARKIVTSVAHQYAKDAPEQPVFPRDRTKVQVN